jgi:hypothetical protein
MISGATSGKESKSMTRNNLLALIEQLESAVAHVEDAMHSVQLAIKRLMADMKSTDEAPGNKLVGGQFRVRDGTSYEVKRGDDQTGPL